MTRLNGSSFIGTASNTPLGNDKTVLANAAGTITAVFYPVNYLNESLGIGDGVTTVFTLTNVPIQPDSQLVYVNGVLKAETTDYTIVDATGAITFLVAPLVGEVITASYAGTVSKVQTLAVGQEIEINGPCTGVTSSASVTLS